MLLMLDLALALGDGRMIRELECLLLALLLLLVLAWHLLVVLLIVLLLSLLLPQLEPALSLLLSTSQVVILDDCAQLPVNRLNSSHAQHLDRLLMDS
jgi:hypothetical protein